MHTDDTVLLRDDGISDDLDLLDILNKDDGLQLYLPSQGNKGRSSGNSAQAPRTQGGPLRECEHVLPSSSSVPESPSQCAWSRGRGDPARRSSTSGGGAAPSGSSILDRLGGSTPDEVALRAILRALEAKLDQTPSPAPSATLFESAVALAAGIGGEEQVAGEPPAARCGGGAAGAAAAAGTAAAAPAAAVAAANAPVRRGPGAAGPTAAVMRPVAGAAVPAVRAAVQPPRSCSAGRTLPGCTCRSRTQGQPRAPCSRCCRAAAAAIAAASRPTAHPPPHHQHHPTQHSYPTHVPPYCGGAAVTAAAGGGAGAAITWQPGLGPVGAPAAAGPLAAPLCALGPPAAMTGGHATATAGDACPYPGADPLAGLPRGVLAARVREAEAQVAALRRSEALARQRCDYLADGVRASRMDRGSAARQAEAARKLAAQHEEEKRALQRRAENLATFLRREKEAREAAERDLAAEKQRSSALAVQLAGAHQQMKHMQDLLDEARQQYRHFLDINKQAVERASRLQDRLRRSGAALSAARQEAAAARLARQQSEAAAVGMRRLVEELYMARASGQLGQALQEQLEALLRQHRDAAAAAAAPLAGPLEGTARAPHAATAAAGESVPTTPSSATCSSQPPAEAAPAATKPGPRQLHSRRNAHGRRQSQAPGPGRLDPSHRRPQPQAAFAWEAGKGAMAAAAAPVGEGSAADGVAARSAVVGPSSSSLAKAAAAAVGAPGDETPGVPLPPDGGAGPAGLAAAVAAILAGGVEGRGDGAGGRRVGPALPGSHRKAVQARAVMTRSVGEPAESVGATPVAFRRLQRRLEARTALQDDLRVSVEQRDGGVGAGRRGTGGGDAPDPLLSLIVSSTSTPYASSSGGGGGGGTYTEFGPGSRGRGHRKSHSPTGSIISAVTLSQAQSSAQPSARTRPGPGLRRTGTQVQAPTRGARRPATAGETRGARLDSPGSLWGQPTGPRSAAATATGVPGARPRAAGAAVAGARGLLDAIAFPARPRVADRDADCADYNGEGGGGDASARMCEAALADRLIDRAAAARRAAVGAAATAAAAAAPASPFSAGASDAAVSPHRRGRAAARKHPAGTRRVVQLAGTMVTHGSQRQGRRAAASAGLRSPGALAAAGSGAGLARRLRRAGARAASISARLRAERQRAQEGIDALSLRLADQTHHNSRVGGTESGGSGQDAGTTRAAAPPAAAGGRRASGAGGSSGVGTRDRSSDEDNGVSKGRGSSSSSGGGGEDSWDDDDDDDDDLAGQRGRDDGGSDNGHGGGSAALELHQKLSRRKRRRRCPGRVLAAAAAAAPANARASIRKRDVRFDITPATTPRAAVERWRPLVGTDGASSTAEATPSDCYGFGYAGGGGDGLFTAGTSARNRLDLDSCPPSVAASEAPSLGPLLAARLAAAAGPAATTATTTAATTAATAEIGLQYFQQEHQPGDTDSGGSRSPLLTRARGGRTRVDSPDSDIAGNALGGGTGGGWVQRRPQGGVPADDERVRGRFQGLWEEEDGSAEGEDDTEENGRTAVQETGRRRLLVAGAVGAPVDTVDPRVSAGRPVGAADLERLRQALLPNSPAAPPRGARHLVDGAASGRDPAGAARAFTQGSAAAPAAVTQAIPTGHNAQRSGDLRTVSAGGAAGARAGAGASGIPVQHPAERRGDSPPASPRSLVWRRAAACLASSDEGDGGGVGLGLDYGGHSGDVTGGDDDGGDSDACADEETDSVFEELAERPRAGDRSGAGRSGSALAGAGGGHGSGGSGSTENGRTDSGLAYGDAFWVANRAAGEDVHGSRRRGGSGCVDYSPAPSSVGTSAATPSTAPPSVRAPARGTTGPVAAAAAARASMAPAAAAEMAARLLGSARATPLGLSVGAPARRPVGRDSSVAQTPGQSRGRSGAGSGSQPETAGSKPRKSDQTTGNQPRWAVDSTDGNAGTVPPDPTSPRRNGAAADRRQHGSSGTRTRSTVQAAGGAGTAAPGAPRTGQTHVITAVAPAQSATAAAAGGGGGVYRRAGSAPRQRSGGGAGVNTEELRASYQALKRQQQLQR